MEICHIIFKRWNAVPLDNKDKQAITSKKSFNRSDSQKLTSRGDIQPVLLSVWESRGVGLIGFELYIN